MRNYFFLVLFFIFMTGELSAYVDYCTGASNLSTCLNGKQDVTMVIDEDIYATVDQTVNSDITLKFTRGAKIILAQNVDLTIAGTIESEPLQIFDLSASGSTVQSTSIVNKPYPEWFGAKTGDAVDDAPYFKKAIDFIPSEGTVKLSNGDYIFNAESIIDKSCNVEGSARTKIIANPGPVIRITTSNIKIESITIEHTGSNPGANSYTIKAGSSSPQSVKISDIYINKVNINFLSHVNVSDGAIYLRHIGDNITVSNCNIENESSDKEGIGIGLVDSYFSNKNIRVFNNNVSKFDTGFKYSGVWIEDNATPPNLLYAGELENAFFHGNHISDCSLGANLYHFKGGVISENIVENNKAGMFVDGQAGSPTVSNNYIYNNKVYGVKFEEFNGSFIGNTVKKNGLDWETGFGHGSYDLKVGAGLVLASTQNATFSGNTITENRWGIYLNNATVAVSTNSFQLNINGNTITNNEGDGIWIDSTVGRAVMISGNNISDNGLASTSTDSSTWIFCGVRVSTSATASGNAKIVVVGNSFLNNVSLSNFGTGGKQRYGVASRGLNIVNGHVDTDGGQFISTPDLIVKSNTFDLYSSLYWKYGNKVYVSANVFLKNYDSQFNLYTNASGTRFYYGNLGYFRY